MEIIKKYAHKNSDLHLACLMFLVELYFKRRRTGRTVMDLLTKAEQRSSGG